MYSTIFTRTRAALVVATVALLAIPTAFAKPAGNQSMSSLGSPDPRETAQSEYATGISAKAMGIALPSQRGVVDLGLSYSSLGPIGSVARDGRSASGQLKPGLSDFGRSYSEIAVPPAHTRVPQTSQATAQVGFDWKDAGVGAGVALLLVGLLGGALAATTRGRQKLSRA